MKSSRRRDSIRSGRRPRSCPRSSSSILRACRNWAAAAGQRVSRQRHRQSARDDHRAVASHLRRHVRQVPGLRICGAHAGGFMPSYNGRFDQGCLAFPANCNKTLKKRPSEYLKQCYFDSMVFTTEGLRHLVEEYGASHIVMGTDYPFPMDDDVGGSHPEDAGPERCRSRWRSSAAIWSSCWASRHSFSIRILRNAATSSVARSADHPAVVRYGVSGRDAADCAAGSPICGQPYPGVQRLASTRSRLQNDP